MNNTIEYGSSLTGTANDIAFALETMQKAGFMICQPVSVDLRDVACQMLGIDGDDDVERLVSELVTAIDQASVRLQATEFISASN